MGHSILLVDDDPDFIEMLQEVLSARAHLVEVARDASAALEKLQVFEPDFVLLDLSLGSADGLDLAPRLRSSSTKRFQLVAVTGWSDQRTRESVREAGFDGFLSKPVDFQKLDAVLRTDKAPT